MAIEKLTKEDGYVKISEGQAQIQISEGEGWVGVTHSSAEPAVDDEAEFTFHPPKVEYSLGSEPCYLRVESDGELTIAVQDIS